MGRPFHVEAAGKVEMRTRSEGIDLDLEARVEATAGGGLLERVAIALGSTLDLKEVLGRLVEMVQEVTSAGRCSILLIDGSHLRPAVAVGDRPDEDLWQAFRSVAPIELGAEHWRVLADGRAVVLEDARTVSLVPHEWVERFILRTVVAVPLVAHGEPIGVLAVDWPEVRAVPDAELAMLEAIGTYAGLAVRNARLHADVAAKSHTMERLVDVAAALNSSSSIPQALDLICESFEQLVGTVHCSVNRTDPSDPLALRTLAARGERWFERLPGAATAIVPEELAPTGEAWQARAGPLVYPSVEAPATGHGAMGTIRSAALFPLFGPDGLLGLVVAGFPQPGGPGAHELETGQTLAELAAAAISRADAHEHLWRRLRQLEVLARLSEAITGEAMLDELLASVSDALASDLGMAMGALVIVEDDLRAAIGGVALTGSEAVVVDEWRRALAAAEALRLRSTGAGVLVPVVHHRQVVGVLRVRVGEEPLGLPDEEFLLAIGGACAEVVYRVMVARSITESDRRVAVVAERERIARDLHDSAGQLVTGMGMKLARYLDDADDDRWRRRLTTLLRLARQADQQLREAVHSLAFADVGQDGLVQSLRVLADHFRATTGIDVRLEVEDDGAAVLPEHEAALFRVAHEALTHIERHAEASWAVLTLGRVGGEVCLAVEDDGLGADAAESIRDAPHLRLALRTAERRLLGVGGVLTVRDGGPHGTRVEARIPVRTLDREAQELT